MRTNLNIITIVQARTGSTRLPRKVLLSLCGKPLLVRMIERVKASQLAGKVIVATSDLFEDNVIADICESEKIECFRGHPTDLLDRHFFAAKYYKADAVVKIPSDCPLIDPNLIDKIIKTYLDNLDTTDYVSNLHPATFPDGNDVEIMSFKTIERTWFEATKDFEREHTTPYIWENPEKFRIKNIVWENGKDYSGTHRWTIDYEEDYIFIREVFESLYSPERIFSMYDILNFLDEKPYIKNINRKYAGSYWYLNHLNELKNIHEYKSKLKNAINE
ncbi:MAG: glycosyltransferase family protein [Melioribacteraceae bacterium]|nr:glycosyltransferase family protein [Melioribacteraceae bacterium]MCF8356462.1 glycosyltransferase family protein [Melioribacteraceae bacterium]MCF8395850.1 glycosyltransferase family protein [Melioribacteraceae bacterium]MCF8420934.1 glycosyltransferase family protein [Melioribacteraceae bacterium]